MPLLAGAALASLTATLALVSTEGNKRVVERFDELLGQADINELDELCTQDMVNHTLAPDRREGLAGTREFLEAQRRLQMNGQPWESLVAVAEGEFVVQFGRRSGHWPGGEFLGIPAAAGDYARDFAVMYRFVDGKIAERWAIRDDLSVLRQLGAIDALRDTAR